MKRNRAWLIMPLFFLFQFTILHYTESKFIERMNRDVRTMEQQMDRDGVAPELKQNISIALGSVEFNVASFVRLNSIFMNLLLLLVVAVLLHINKVQNHDSP